MPSQAALSHCLVRKTLGQHLLDFGSALLYAVRATQGRILKNGGKIVESLAHLLRGRARFCDGQCAAQEHDTEKASHHMVVPT
jgi:hypothetical protein